MFHHETWKLFELFKTALIYASDGNHIEIVKTLLEQNGIDINAKNRDGETELIWASKNGHTEIVKLLLEQKGIDVDAKNLEGETALICASVNGHTEIVKSLLKQKGIDINTKGRYVGYTPLMWASKNGHAEIVKLLLEQKGININAKDGVYFNQFILFQKFYWELFKLFDTAIILASKNGRTEIVKLLLEQKDININAKNREGDTALILASEGGYVEIVKLLLEQKGINIHAKNIYLAFLLFILITLCLMQIFRTN